MAVLRASAARQISRIAVQQRLFHTSLLCYQEEEYEIDLITLHKRPKKKSRNSMSAMLDSMDEASKNDFDKEKELKETLFDDAMKFVKQDKVKKIEVNMPPKGVSTSTEDHEIVNVQKPKISQKETSIHTGNNFISESTGKTHRIQDIMKLVSQEVPELSNEAQKLANDIESNIMRMKEIRAKIEEAEQREQEALNKYKDQPTDIKQKDLENFLNDAKLSKDRDDEQHFREQRRFEWTQSLQSSRSLTKKNFFTPVDEGLIRSVKRSIPKMEQQGSDDVLFPSLPKFNATMTHEFLVHVNGKQIITTENPFGPHYLAPDLASMFYQISTIKPLIKVVNKLSKSKWRLIGTQVMGDTRVLVFERYIDKKQERREKKMKALKVWSSLIVGSFATLYTIGFFLEEKGAKWSIDQDGELVKR